MIDFLIGDHLKRIVNGLTVVMTVALLFELGIGIFAGNYFDIYHVLLPGYVPIKPISRFAMTIYVAPWVANLHQYLFWTFFVSFGALIVLAVARLVAFKVARSGVSG